MVSFNRTEIGKLAEHAACHFLQTKGLRLLVQNYYCRFGEIDLIMQDQQDIVFVEVRSRSRKDYGSAAESITTSKKKKLFKTSTHYLQRKQWLYTVPSRFDVVSLHHINGKTELEWFKNAFSPD